MKWSRPTTGCTVRLSGIPAMITAPVEMQHGLVFAKVALMNERSQIVQEYFELMVLLNRSNTYANQNTEIHFLIVRQSRDQFVLSASINQNFRNGFLMLCLWEHGSIWEEAGYSGLFNLERYCASELNRAVKHQNLEAETITPKEFNSLAEEIQKKLKSLALAKKFSES